MSNRSNQWSPSRDLWTQIHVSLLQERLSKHATLSRCDKMVGSKTILWNDLHTVVFLTAANSYCSFLLPCMFTLNALLYINFNGCTWCDKCLALARHATSSPHQKVHYNVESQKHILILKRSTVSSPLNGCAPIAIHSLTIQVMSCAYFLQGVSRGQYHKGRDDYD